eukprot:1026618-Prymnesium_polylepis.1
MIVLSSNDELISRLKCADERHTHSASPTGGHTHTHGHSTRRVMPVTADYCDACSVVVVTPDMFWAPAVAQREAYDELA